MARCTLRGTDFNIMQLPRLGEGPARDLVLCHGLAASMGFWPVDFIGQLRQEFRVTLFDQRGHGRSGITETGYGAAALGADLAALISELGLERPDIVAHSFGGVAALAMLAETPEAARSLTLLDSQIGLGRQKAAQAGDSIEPDLLGALAAIGITLDAADPFLGVHMITALAEAQIARPDLASEDPRVAFLLRSMPPARAKRWLAMGTGSDAVAELTADDGLEAARLARLDLPVLGIYGRKSPARHTGALLQACLPDFRLEVFDEAGHFFVTSQGPRVVALCRAFWGLEAPVAPAAAPAVVAG